MAGNSAGGVGFRRGTDMQPRPDGAAEKPAISASIVPEWPAPAPAFAATPAGLAKQERRKMGFAQYHEPPQELSQAVRTFARMIASLIEEAEAISWYEQRMAVETDAQARAIMKNAQTEEFKHFGLDLEFLLRAKADWRAELKEILFTTGDIVERGEKREDGRLTLPA
jgi:hypothetical protein